MAPSSSSVFGGPASLRPRHEDQEVFQQHKNQCPPDQHRTKSKDVSTAPVDRTAARQLPSDSATFGASAATVVGRCWTEVYGFNDSGLPTAHVAFTLDLHIPGQMLRKCTIIVVRDGRICVCLSHADASLPHLFHSLSPFPLSTFALGEVAFV